MDKTYNHALFEDKIYQKWEASGAFSPIDNPNAKPFTIIMPPPNANDPLHVGHAMFVTVEDILIRYHRMLGEAALWLPGADHAGIETQYVFEKKLKKEGKSRFDFDRKTLYQMIWDYVAENSSIAKNQLKKIGASADWSRFKFTLDEDIVEIVIETFKLFHTKGLLYRDLRLVNYCTRCGTGYSELEAKHELKKDPMLFIKYGQFTIATVRPETKFRDTALAVNPTDQRYKQYIGKTFEIPGLLGNIKMTVIADNEVDPKFGTGIMKVTPAHDFHDFDLGKKYDLPVTPIIDFNGKMDFSWYINSPDFTNQAVKYQERAKLYHGLHVSKARPLMIEHLKEDGLLIKIDEKYEHTIATCYRCGSTLEPLPLPQFFIKVKPLTDKVLKTLKNKEVKIHGPGYDKILIHWLKNLKDWNISRQIVWGIRIPIWYNVKCQMPNAKCDIEVVFIDKNKQVIKGSVSELLNTYPLEEIKAGLQSLKAPVGAEYVVSKTSPGDDFIQETDTFDTWFSSSQWPYATLLTSDKRKKISEKPDLSPIASRISQSSDFNRFYPTQVMETAYDILIFWVMRMLMVGVFVTDKAPFKDVYLHGLIRDEKGQKMSKSKGNVINPLSVIEKYGADSLRMALVMSTSAGKDSNTGEEKIRGMRNFTNKIWNAARFILMNRKNLTTQLSSRANEESVAIPSGLLRRPLKGTPRNDDQEFYKKLNDVVSTITKQLDQLKIGLAAETVYQEFWHWFCDKAIEQAKNGEISQEALETGLTTFLKLLHPFVPFVTEEIWQRLNHEDLLITQLWPGPNV